jgi:D-tagatose-bisphosphate aldolase class II non-catalytic subunit
MNGPIILQDLVAANCAGARRGIASWCTAHPDTLRAILRCHRDVEGPILIEATCNQVNHLGGYTGMTPSAFRRFLENLASEAGVDSERIILGGDHLGPNPWKHLSAAAAMAEAKAMVQAYVEAGFSKIHLDASMACADDKNLGEAEMARRAAELCAVAEAFATQPLAYVIGTEVPIPGGETEVLDTLAATRPETVWATYSLHDDAFRSLGLSKAFERVIGLVVQPGVDFGNAQVFAFDAAKAKGLISTVSVLKGAAFEAHSTDYQTAESLAALVAGHFAILKVGPELTFAYREAIFALAAIEEQLPLHSRSNVVATIDDVMNRNPTNWRGYVQAGEDERLLKLFGLSDRVRYYWPDAKIDEAVRKLRETVDGRAIPQGLVMQYAGDVEPGPERLSTRLIESRVGAVVRKYLEACG